MSRIFIFALISFCLLSACQSSEERAEEHYQRALELLEEGDLDRARVEFANVFELNGTHVEARLSFADTLRENGQFQGAYSQYLRLAEQLPDDAGVRLALAEMALEAGVLEQAREHGHRLLELAPDTPEARVVELNLDYVDAVEEEDAPARREIAARAAEMVGDDPGSLLLQRVLIDNALREGDLDAALDALDAALEAAPGSRPLHDLKLSVLAQLQDTAAIEAQLRDMLARFPEDEALVATTLRFYVSRGEAEQAVAFLRERMAGAEGERHQGYALALVRLLLETSGQEAALDELAALSEETPGTPVYRMLAASIRFDAGETEAAIDDLQALIDGAEPGAAINDVKVTLARMLDVSGNPVGAQRLIEEVLETDATHVEALKMRAARLIRTDQADAAIATLRTVLDEAPGDTEAMTLMAAAHERNGNRELMREFLLLAVETSNNAPAESLRYARALAEEERYLPAEEVLIEALRMAPANLGILDMLGEIYIALEDWPRAEQVEARFEEIGTEAAQDAAAGQRVARLAAQGRTEDAIGVLEALAAEAPDGDLRAEVAVVRAQLASGSTDAARTRAAELLERDPDSPVLLLTMGLTEAADGDGAAATARFRELVQVAPQFEQGWIALIRSLYAQGDIEAAEAVLAEGLEALPEALNLLWAQAGFLESTGNIEGAIEVYETMYARAPDAPVVANNLASLISSVREDAESLERAHTIARRLRGSEVPAFADTYGWIAFRRGNIEEAETHLARAAEGLPDDPLVQYHYARVLAETGQAADALERYRRAVDLAGPEDTRPQLQEARTEITRLEAALAAEEEAGNGAEDEGN